MRREFTLLLCEDDANDRLLFQRILGESSQEMRLPIKFEAAQDGEEAIEYLSGTGRFIDRTEHPFPDLIVLDLKMPRVDGVEVLKWLKDHPEYRRIPKVMVSGSAEEKDIDAAYEQGVSSYFQKPGSLQGLRALVKSMIKYWAQTEKPLIKHRFALR